MPSKVYFLPSSLFRFGPFPSISSLKKRKIGPSKNENKKEEMNGDGRNSSLLNLPCELLVNKIFAQVDVKDICALKQVCRQFNEICTKFRPHLPQIKADFVFIQCGRWQNVLERRKNKKKSSNSLLAIDFNLPFSNGFQRFSGIKYEQLVENFEFEFAFLDVEVLNLDLLARLNLDKIAANRLFLNFHYGRNEWPIRHCWPRLSAELAANSFAQSIDIIFPEDQSTN